MNDEDLKEVEIVVDRCASKCIKWPYFLSILALAFVVIVGAGWAVSNTKMDASAFNEHQKADDEWKRITANEACQTRVLITRLYNAGVEKDKQWPEPLCSGLRQ